MLAVVTGVNGASWASVWGGHGGQQKFQKYIPIHWMCELQKEPLVAWFAIFLSWKALVIGVVVQFS